MMLKNILGMREQTVELARSPSNGRGHSAPFTGENIMQAKKIVQQVALVISFGVAASAHAQLLGRGGAVGGSLGGMVGGAGQMGGRLGGMDSITSRGSLISDTRSATRAAEAGTNASGNASGSGSAGLTGGLIPARGRPIESEASGSGSSSASAGLSGALRPASTRPINGPANGSGAGHMAAPGTASTQTTGHGIAGLAGGLTSSMPGIAPASSGQAAAGRATGNPAGSSAAAATLRASPDSGQASDGTGHGSGQVAAVADTGGLASAGRSTFGAARRSVEPVRGGARAQGDNTWNYASSVATTSAAMAGGSGQALTSGARQAGHAIKAAKPTLEVHAQAGGSAESRGSASGQVAN
jgi:hypothetical protein